LKSTFDMKIKFADRTMVNETLASFFAQITNASQDIM
jgi:hypothetical protein